VERLFPMYLKLAGQRVLVVGGGKVAEGKIDGLLDTGAVIRVIAPKLTERVVNWARAGRVALEQRTVTASDLEGVFMVIVATSSAAVNEFVYGEARMRSVLCNVVDVPDQCDFYYPAVVRRGDLQIAISTSGHSPSLARRIRQQLEQKFGEGYAEWVRELGVTRREILKSNLDSEQKQFLLKSLASREALKAMVANDARQKSEGDAA
jgi:precorrin-2 dehydrogenase / sirohydrochlorin ferrochelatase